MNTGALMLAAALAASDGGTGVSFEMPSDGFATVVVEEAATGRRVRNLFSAEPLAAGRHKIEWDGYDDAGEPCVAGKYRWRGLVRGEIESRYLGSFYSPGDPPWRTMSQSYRYNLHFTGAGGWLSDHCPPLCVAAAGGDVFVGAQMAEAGCAAFVHVAYGNGIRGSRRAGAGQGERGEDEGWL